MDDQRSEILAPPGRVRVDEPLVRPSRPAVVVAHRPLRYAPLQRATSDEVRRSGGVSRASTAKHTRETRLAAHSPARSRPERRTGDLRGRIPRPTHRRFVCFFLPRGGPPPSPRVPYVTPTR